MYCIIVIWIFLLVEEVNKLDMWISGFGCGPGKISRTFVVENKCVDFFR